MASDKPDERALLWLFQNEKKNDRQPELSGFGRISKKVLKEFIDAYKEFGDGENLKLNCAAWKKQGKNGPYTFVTIEPEKPRPETVGTEDDIPF